MQEKEKKIEMFREWEWKKYKEWRCQRLENKDFTIIASNCVGTLMYYDLNMKFLSPTINLTIGMGDFVRFAENLKWYMDQELLELKGEKKYPIGIVDNIKINFVHYKNFEEAKQKWRERKKRINWNNLFLIGVEKENCTYKTIQSFERLPYKNKVILTRMEYPEITSSYYIRGFEEKSELGTITNFEDKFLKRRYMDDFDYVSFLNHGIIGQENKYRLLLN